MTNGTSIFTSISTTSKIDEVPNDLDDPDNDDIKKNYKFPHLHENNIKGIPKGGMLYGEYLHVSLL